MEVYSIGFTKKTAGQFFDLLKSAGIRRLLDVRLTNAYNSGRARLTKLLHETPSESSSA